MDLRCITTLNLVFFYTKSLCNFYFIIVLTQTLLFFISNLFNNQIGIARLTVTDKLKSKYFLYSHGFLPITYILIYIIIFKEMWFFTMILQLFLRYGIPMQENYSFTNICLVTKPTNLISNRFWISVSTFLKSRSITYLKPLITCLKVLINH